MLSHQHKVDRVNTPRSPLAIPTSSSGCVPLVDHIIGKKKTTPKVQMFLSNIIFLEGVASSRSHRTLPGKQTSWLYRYEADLIGLEASGHWNQFDGVFFFFFFLPFLLFLPWVHSHGQQFKFFDKDLRWSWSLACCFFAFSFAYLRTFVCVTK